VKPGDILYFASDCPIHGKKYLDGNRFPRVP
jgi:hypothetical protein